MTEREVLMRERDGLAEQIAEMEQEIVEDTERERECRTMATSRFADWYSDAMRAEKQRSYRVFAEQAAARIVENRIKVRLRRRWLRGIERTLADATGAGCPLGGAWR